MSTNAVHEQHVHLARDATGRRGIIFRRYLQHGPRRPWTSRVRARAMLWDQPDVPVRFEFDDVLDSLHQMALLVACELSWHQRFHYAMFCRVLFPDYGVPAVRHWRRKPATIRIYRYTLQLRIRLQFTHNRVARVVIPLAQQFL